MGFFNNLIKNTTDKEDEFTKMIRARDNGEEWAQQRLDELFQKNDPDIYERINEARQVIYAEDARRGDPKAMYYYGTSSYDFNVFMQMLVPLAEHDDIEAITAIARRYGLGISTEENPEESFKWYLKAAGLGDVFSQNMVAKSYTYNDSGSGEINYNKAFEWYSAAAEQGSATGFCGLGECYKYWQMQQMNNERENVDLNQVLEYDEKIIDCYEAARQYLASEDEEINTLFGLADSYSTASYHVNNKSKELMLQKEAIFFYYAAADCGHPNAMKYAEKIAEENGINVDFNNMMEWAEQEGIIG